MGVDEGNLQVMDIEMTMENFPVHTSHTVRTNLQVEVMVWMLFEEKSERI